MKNTTTIAVMAIVVILVAVGAFFGGMKYQQGKQQSPRQFNGAQGQRTGSGATGNRTGFRPVSGEIISADDKSITVKLQDGSSKIVLLSDKTEINKADQATKADLKVGEKVAAFGQENSDGSVTAQSIQLNPLDRNFQGQPPNNQ